MSTPTETDKKDNPENFHCSRGIHLYTLICYYRPFKDYRCPYIC